MTPVKVHMFPKNDNNKTTANLYIKMKSTLTLFLSIITNNRDNKQQQNHDNDTPRFTTRVTTGWPNYEISNDRDHGESREQNICNDDSVSLHPSFFYLNMLSPFLLKTILSSIPNNRSAEYLAEWTRQWQMLPVLR